MKPYIFIFISALICSLHAFAKGGLTIGQSLDCHIEQNKETGYIITRTGESSARILSYWPGGRDSEDRALSGSYRETDAPVLVLVDARKMQLETEKEIYYMNVDIAINQSGTDAEIASGSGMISFSSSIQNKETGEATLDHSAAYGIVCR